MSAPNKEIQSVPTNIITGFLGAGKTTTVLNLLKNKPENERWAVLVNEFGEICVDGSLLQSQSEDQKIYIKEVPGGCMCCAAGVPMKVALNNLLKEAKPDRLLIEPTGLGHPKEILQVLSSEHYKKVLRIEKTITLVEARHLSDTRYTEHDTFKQQITIADIIVGNKHDLYQLGDHYKLQAYIETFNEGMKHVIFSQQGQIPIVFLSGDTTSINMTSKHHDHEYAKTLAVELPMPPSGIIKAQNQGEGFSSIGWRFSADKKFNKNALNTLLLIMP